MPKPKVEDLPVKLSHFLFHEPEGSLDKFEALLLEDQALRHAEYDKPDPKRRRLRVACNECQTPFCCNQRVTVTLVEALVIYRYAATHLKEALAVAIERGKQLREAPPLEDADFFRRGVGCPFLLRGECGVFPVRPQRCRSHYMGGNPIRCKSELAPSETYEMNPDNGILSELDAIADDVQFFGLISEVGPSELSEMMYFVDRLSRTTKWKEEKKLDWSTIE